MPLIVRLGSRRRESDPRRVPQTQAVFYRDKTGVEPLNDFIEPWLPSGLIGIERQHADAEPEWEIAPVPDLVAMEA
jgi:hypothetical protein